MCKVVVWIAWIVDRIVANLDPKSPAFADGYDQHIAGYPRDERVRTSRKKALSSNAIFGRLREGCPDRGCDPAGVVGKAGRRHQDCRGQRRQGDSTRLATSLRRQCVKSLDQFDRGRD